jgi:hypothetical protein
VIDWRRVPWTLWVLAVFFMQIIVRFFVTTPVKAGTAVSLALITLGWLYFLLLGFRYVWMATVAVLVVGSIVDLAGGHSYAWWIWVANVAELALLLMPVTRRFFKEQAVAA